MSKKNRQKRLGNAPTSQLPATPKGIPDGMPATLLSRTTSQIIRSGPIPDPDQMERYRKVQPDLPDRIMRQFERRTDMAERQATHRMNLETKVIGNNILMERLGWFSATSLGGAVLVGSLWLIHDGKQLTGLAGVIFALASLLGLYVWGRRDQVQEIAKKRAAEMARSGATPEQLDLQLSPPQE